MTTTRRDVALSAAAAASLLAGAPAEARPKRDAEAAGGAGLYGVISQMLTEPNKRVELAQVLLEASRDMPGCISFVIAGDLARDDAIWVTEVWESKEAHVRSLNLPEVQAAIEKSRGLISGMGTRAETVPVAGVKR